MTEFRIPAPELARLTHNALAFMPARSAVKVCRFAYSNGEVAIGATDLFTVGSDRWFGEGEPGTAAIDLSREDLQALDKYARGKKKEDIRLRIIDQDGLTILEEDAREHGAVCGTFLDSSHLRQPQDLWDLCDEMMSRPTPDHLCLIDPKFMSAFGKIKASGGAETIADLSIADESSPISVKIGATFRGAIMPVDRGDAAESDSVGPEGLWSDEKVDS